MKNAQFWLIKLWNYWTVFTKISLSLLLWYIIAIVSENSLLNHENGLIIFIFTSSFCNKFVIIFHGGEGDVEEAKVCETLDLVVTLERGLPHYFNRPLTHLSPLALISFTGTTIIIRVARLSFSVLLYFYGSCRLKVNVLHKLYLNFSRVFEQKGNCDLSKKTHPCMPSI